MPPIVSLLPPNATAQERALEATLARVEQVAIPIASLWDPATCPAALLPWLAWTYSVDSWVSSWSDEQKRAIVAASLAVHRRKGTVAAVEDALSALGYPVELLEWFATTPQGAPYTFAVNVDVDEQGLDEALYNQLLAVISATKNVRSELTQMTLRANVHGVSWMGGVVAGGHNISILPYNPGLLVSESIAHLGGATTSGAIVDILEAA